MAYIGGYITQTIHKKICDDCSKFLTVDALSDQDFLKCIDLEQYNSVLEGEGLIRPSKNLMNSLISIEGIYNSCVDQCISTYSGNLKETQLAHARAQSGLCLSLSSECCDGRRKVVVRFAYIRLERSLL